MRKHTHQLVAYNNCTQISEPAAQRRKQISHMNFLGSQTGIAGLRAKERKEEPMEGLNVTSSSQAIRFLGHLERPASHEDPFELDESDVVWSADSNDADPESPPVGPPHPPGFSAAPRLVRRRPSLDPTLSAISAARVIPRASDPDHAGPEYVAASAPVNVPTWPDWKKSRSHGDWEDPEEEKDDDKDDDGGRLVPPHEIVARSQLTTTFSVFEGVGRTLKGRDLRRVRNAVFQKTGFLE